ncbi:transposase [Streptomyces sp. NPDC059874]|uniref:transposase n=1 Tax=Streptomyces sp. NPDC059874 TaxID=3346983 RepID=UPI0036475903
MLSVSAALEAVALTGSRCCPGLCWGGHDRTVLNGIVWKFRTGVAWRDVPERYGSWSWSSLHIRFRRWAADGAFERMLQWCPVPALHRARRRWTGERRTGTGS